MKKFTWIFLSLLIVFTACKKKSDNSVQTTPPLTGTVILSQTVNSSGGTLAVENFTLVVPAGTFTAPTTLSISKLTNTPFGSDAKLPVYFINNLPVSFGQPLTLTLGGVNTNDSLTSFIAEPTTLAESPDTCQVTYRKISHTIANGKVTVIIPTIPSSRKKSGTDGSTETLSVGVAVTALEITINSSNNHFALTLPAGYLDQATQLATFLEDAYTTYSTAPFSFDFTRRTSWPLEVTLTALDPDIYGFQTTSMWGNNDGYMEFNTLNLSQTSELKVTAGHEFLHIVESWYDPRNSWAKAKEASNFLWLDEACAVWAEGLFADPGYISSARKGYELAPLEAGLSEGREDLDARHFGYGMSGVIKYIVDNYGGESMIRKIYEYIYNGHDAADAILNAMNIQYQDWYGNMIIDYSQGKIYSDVIANILVAANTTIFTAKSMADSVTTFNGSYIPLASKIYVLNISASAVNDQTALSIAANMTGYQMISLYSYKAGSPLALLGQSADTVSVPGIKAMINSGYKFIAVFTNLNYYGSNNSATQLSFTAKLKSQKTYYALLLDFSVYCHIKEYTPKDSLLFFWDDNLYYFSTDSVPCTQNGNIVTASYKSPASGTIIVTINPDNTVSYIITNYSYTGTDAQYGPYTYTGNCSITNFPFTRISRNRDGWVLTDTYPNINSFYFHTLWSSGYYYTYEPYDDGYNDAGTQVWLYFTNGSSKGIDHFQIHKPIIPPGKR
jgi:hypothetical protein